MLDVLSGFATIWAVIGVGAAVAHLGVLGQDAQRLLSRFAFFIGLPPLLFMMMSRADLGRIFSLNVVVSIGAILVSAGLYLGSCLLRARLAGHERPGLGHTVIGTFCSAYVNANNMGVPIASYVMKDTGWVAPVLMIQVIVLQPLGLSLLDADDARRTGGRTRLLHNASTPFRNPMTIGVLLGLAVNLLGRTPPALVADTLDLLGGVAVPSMLVAFGISLRLGPPPGRENRGETLLICALKLLVQPVSAWVLARVLGLDLATTLAVVVMAGLPTAQNVFVFSSRYGTSVSLARDVIFITTVCSIPAITLYAALVHALG
ncbi:AEC family transporter [uncultured Propionibacterium sp.]|uniref:AEC family transporter n=1 Tax=uncultured Propionibacterium sp. TaxID=218066 RepID=UPI00292DE96E|nr:AEC family transporter [uncultured Propionibacterium sp.]